MVIVGAVPDAHLTVAGQVTVKLPAPVRRRRTMGLPAAGGAVKVRVTLPVRVSFWA